MKEQAGNIRTGWVIEYNGRQWTVLRTQLIQPGRWCAFIQVEMRSLDSGNKTNHRFSTSETVEKLMSDQKDCQYLYKDGDNLIFMDKETYDQFEIPAEMLGDAEAFLQDNMDVIVNFIEGKPVGVDLPKNVILTVKETEPYIKGQTVNSSYKPAIMENGVRVMIPPFVTEGERIVVATADCTYVERAK